jgi:hypothetical protein
LEVDPIEIDPVTGREKHRKSQMSVTQPPVGHLTKNQRKKLRAAMPRVIVDPEQQWYGDIF